MFTLRTAAAAAASTLALLGAGAAAAPGASAAPNQYTMDNVQLTLYGGQDGDNITSDNDNPRGIAWPKSNAHPSSIHTLAGGNGTWENPTTLAVANPRKGGPFQPGTRFYIPAVHRYFIAEDTCAECLHDLHRSTPVQHVDMWAGKNATQRSMNAYPANGRHKIIVNPSKGMQVTSGPLLTH
ncbi:hypothetical protein [Corynebacterium bovis]|uniref:Uncharacterized protein n=2 Tax=Corynebacterium bovis TaxID=36808 RepID=A0A426PYM5_9CORY|nr:hypothetical protein [Corynebacterium bovis]MBB3116057.1 hypothetical protein [Corynebacterium bovis DSM 20582 = CIP 54.80]MDN8580003.1 hypothetical protein [Corynebacterium bovis]QQC46995.1 hypothetical protein I6I09_07885 [Corynebacterium bovis]RRO79734.1 hypothetical protein CXF38_08580 [Corynebacterium bovis]RRO81123.1 hypothetical protein CXF36_07565 [Corynebacterium bovis]